jgi:DNA topoisomerase-1
LKKRNLTAPPAAPFTTSTLQQEAGRRLGFSVKQTMAIAQKMYESGLITYMRTDSTNLSSLAINTAKAKITELYGEKYSRPRQYKTKVRGAQEAHEAIRPTYMANQDIEGTATEKKLYNLIWKRTIASQMADAVMEKTAITIASDKFPENFSIDAENVLFDGFLKVYMEGRDEEDREDKGQNIVLPALKTGQAMDRIEIDALERFTSHPQRYTEASLVKKMEELEIGRPSTYAPTISTLFERGYTVKGNRDGKPREFALLSLKGESIEEKDISEVVGGERAKLFPENIGIEVVDYLKDHFPAIIDYGFTANMEQNLDSIAEGKKVWYNVLRDFYGPFHKKVDEVASSKTTTSKVERLLGKDPASGKSVYAKMGRYGAYVQLGESDDKEKKYASLPKGQLIETIKLDEAMSLLQLPRNLGEYNGQDIVVNIGRFGPYIKTGTKFVSLGKDVSPYTVTLEKCREIIDADAAKLAASILKSYPEEGITVINGRYGPYIKKDKKNYKIPRGTKVENLSLDACKDIIAKAESETVTKKK